MKSAGVLFLALAVGVFAESPVYIENEQQEQQQQVIEDVNRIGPHYVPAPYAHAYGYPDGFGVQTGYEGFLVPSPQTGLLTKPGFLKALPTALNLFRYASKFGGILFNVLSHFLIGGALNLAVCTLTPFCTLTFFGFGLRKEKVREQLRSFITPTMLDQASRFLRLAIEKYDQLQEEWRKEEDQENEIETENDEMNNEA